MGLRFKAVNQSLWRLVVNFASGAALAMLLLALQIDTARAQSGYAPLVVTQPIVDTLDENYVSILSGKPQFTIPAVKLGDVSFEPFSYTGHFAKSGVADNNRGHIELCQGVLPSQGGYAGSYPCAIGGSSGYGIQAIHGQDRATFVYANPGYRAYGDHGATFVDNGSTCTWTKRDGTKVVFVAYHEGSNPLCKSNNISQIIYPDGRIATYYYYGSFSTAVWDPSPILSIVTNSGYMLKYNYSGTPNAGDQTSVTAINRAFETCDPAAVSCSLSNAWPTATLTFQDKTVSTSDAFPPISPTYSPFRHYLFTIEEASHRKHVFELDSYFRVISYQPAGATAPQYTYKLCSNLVGDDLRYCFGMTHWNHLVPDMPPLYFDQVESATHNGQTWQYGPSYTLASVPYNSTWWRLGYDPRGRNWEAKGNSTPGTETTYGGSTVSMTMRDGTVMGFAWTVANQLTSVLTPLGIKTQYDYGARGNLEKVTRNPVANSGQPVLIQSAGYPPACTSMASCNKPTYVTDAKGYTSNFTYDPTHGGVLTVTHPAVNGIRPQIRSTYVQRNAWYLESSGTMTRDTRPIWLLETESFCRTSAAVDAGCATPGDQVVTAYEYGPDSGPNNLLLRGKSLTADGTTLRTCYGHDKQGNKIWETSPNANPSSCTVY